jgi:valyl-tRNA synthetase
MGTARPAQHPRSTEDLNVDTSPYCIVIPPPNVTGTLHMGHAFQHTLMDILIRYHRMMGRKTLWQTGTDAAGIATQMVVERQLQHKGIQRCDLSREDFIQAVWDWKNQSGARIHDQIRRMGASVDWETERFTMDEGMNTAVTESFVALYEKGLIYKSARLVNWDPKLQTALSDLEVEHHEEAGSLWVISYPLCNTAANATTPDQFIPVATTRPETLFGDVAIAVHPDDPRYQQWIGHRVKLPLTDRSLPIIADPEVLPEFGTGAVKITPAHDFNDYETGKRHGLNLVNILNPDGTLNTQVPAPYQGQSIQHARAAVLHNLTQAGQLISTTPYTLNVPRGDRSGAVIEPYLMDQWYIKVEPLAEPARAVVEQKLIRFIPEQYVNTYFSWMNNLQDWCISRQLWWGNRIPVWYDPKGQYYVGRNEKEIRDRHQLRSDILLTQESDVLDTWFAAALWPFASLGWPQDLNRMNHFYPTQVLMTGFDIIFFWVARMIMMGLFTTHNIPFQEVYITGLIRDANGQKMSKSKGNIIDPLDLVDGITLEDLVQKRTSGMMQPQLAEKIATQTRQEFPHGIAAYGTDALRFTLTALASTNRNINFDLKRLEGYRHFCNKLWNASRFVLMNIEGHTVMTQNLTDFTQQASLPDQWIFTELHNTIARAHQYLKHYRFDLLAQTLYEFVWEYYCDWYLELAKTLLYPTPTNPQAIQRAGYTRYTLIHVLDAILRLLHPIIPFITEEIWQRLRVPLGIQTHSIMTAAYPCYNPNLVNLQSEKNIKLIQSVILAIRNIRGEMSVPPGQRIPLLYIRNASTEDQLRLQSNHHFIKSLSKCDQIDYCTADQTLSLCATGLAQHLEILIPLAGLIDLAKERTRLTKEIEKLEKNRLVIQQKLDNPDFRDKAPKAVLAQEEARLVENQRALGQLQAQLMGLG